MRKCGEKENFYKEQNFGGEYYGISTDSLKENIACIQIVDSIADVKQRAKQLGFEDMKIVSFYIHVTAEERTKRMLTRGDSIESIQKRLEIDSVKFKKARDVADYTIENNVLEQSINEIINLYK